MANHCYNWMYLTGDTDQLKSLVERLKQPKVEESHLWYRTFYLLFPETNKYYPGMSEDDDYDVYEVYGSKWFDCYSEWEDDYSSVTISGDSAWSPVDKLARKLSEAYQLNVEIEYEEPGNDFGGRAVYDKGVTISEESYTYRVHTYKMDCYHAMQRIEEDVEMDYWADLEEFKDNESELWEVLSDSHRKEIISIFDRYAELVKQSENER